jgi:hypothetical protein
LRCAAKRSAAGCSRPTSSRELIDEIPQGLSRAYVADIALAAEQDHAAVGHHRTQMLLRQGTADRARGRAGDEAGFAGPGILAIGPLASIDAFFRDYAPA